VLVLVLLLITISLGYAFFIQNLTIHGTGKIGANLGYSF
jgi:hypothetical protein